MPFGSVATWSEHLDKFAFLSWCGFTLKVKSVSVWKQLFNRPALDWAKSGRLQICALVKSASPAFIEMPSLTHCVLLLFQMLLHCVHLLSKPTTYFLACICICICIFICVCVCICICIYNDENGASHSFVFQSYHHLLLPCFRHKKEWGWRKADI